MHQSPKFRRFALPLAITKIFTRFHIPIDRNVNVNFNLFFFPFNFQYLNSKFQNYKK